MRTPLVLLAAVMMASAAVAGTSDPQAGERYRMKYGRNTPQEEARQVADEKEQALHARKCPELGRCMRRHVETAAAPAPAANDQEQRAQVKYGRSPSQRKAIDEEQLLAASPQWIGCEQPCCTHGQ